VDRIDAMKIFVAALEEGGLRKAGRKLGRSPAAISRALASLEAHVGVTLLHRTTRSFKLSDAGERYLIVCRRVIADLEEADLQRHVDNNGSSRRGRRYLAPGIG